MIKQEGQPLDHMIFRN